MNQEEEMNKDSIEEIQKAKVEAHEEEINDQKESELKEHSVDSSPKDEKIPQYGENEEVIQNEAQKEEINDEQNDEIVVDANIEKEENEEEMNQNNQIEREELNAQMNIHQNEVPQNKSEGVEKLQTFGEKREINKISSIKDNQNVIISKNVIYTNQISDSKKQGEINGDIHNQRDNPMMYSFGANSSGSKINSESKVNVRISGKYSQGRGSNFIDDKDKNIVYSGRGTGNFGGEKVTGTSYYFSNSSSSHKKKGKREPMDGDSRRNTLEVEQRASENSLRPEPRDSKRKQ